MTSELFALMNHFHSTKEQFKANHKENTLTLLRIPNTPPNIERIQYECEQIINTGGIGITPLDPSDQETDIVISILNQHSTVTAIL